MNEPKQQPIPATSSDKAVNPAMPFSSPVLKWVIVLLPLAYFWFRLINNLWPEWMTNPQYGYGLLVPLLCIGLLVRRWHGFSEIGDRRSQIGFQHFSISAFQLLVFALAFLYLPTRLIEAATPEWRPIQWLLGIEAVGLTLCVIELGKGRGWLRQLAFPICFFFVAIPWPSLVEQPIIQTLTRASATIVVELLGWVDVPAMVHGNVIEVSTGMVGIDEACSGIRSFQSSLMISLFLGEFYRLSPWRRSLLIPAGFIFSMAFNVGRMFLLTLIAAKKGVPAISEYHDPAGFTIAILCTLGLWALAWGLGKRGKAESGVGTTGRRTKGLQDDETTGPKVSSPVVSCPGVSGSSAVVSSPVVTTLNSQPSTLNQVALILIVWLVAVEAGVELWYRHVESHFKPGPEWSLVFPASNPTLKEIPIPADTQVSAAL